MPSEADTNYSIEWLVPARVIHVRAWGVHRLDTMRQYSQEIKGFIAQGTAPIHLITDDSHITKMPSNFSVIQELLSFARDPKMGWVLSVGNSSPIIRFGSQLVARVLGVKQRRFNTFDEAVKFLKARDTSIRWNGLDHAPS